MASPKTPLMMQRPTIETGYRAIPEKQEVSTPHQAPQPLKR